jgi:tripeptidyl-peptidase-1
MSCKAIQQVGLQVNWPASSPYVTAVGATMGVESGREETTCQIQCDVQGERCTSQGQGPAITSGGGFSAYDKPDYQSGHVQCQGRGVPDIALAGHAYEVVVGGEKVLVDGTSASAPTFGGMVSLVNARRLASGLSSVGFINPALYQHASAFNDIKFGNNKCGTFDAAGVAKCCGGFEAGPGWDATTGLGSVDFQKFEAIFAPVDAATTTITTSSPPVITTDAATTTATTPAGTTTATSTTTAGNMTAKKGNVLVV